MEILVVCGLYPNRVDELDETSFENICRFMSKLGIKKPYPTVEYPMTR